jgi:hypothetical protein
MREIASGVWHWTAHHKGIGADVHSYFLAKEGVVIDPMKPSEGAERLGEIATPREVVLTNRHHYRASGEIRQAYGTPVRCHRTGMHEFTKGEKVEPFDFGDRFAGGVEAFEVGVLCPEETALYLDREGGILALGDCVIRWDPEGPLGFVPDVHMGDDPVGVKKGLKRSIRQILDEIDVDILLLAHGEPLVRGAEKVLRSFVEGPGAR